MYQISLKIIFIIFIFCMMNILPQHLIYGRSLTEIRKSKEIRICIAGSGHDFYKKNAAAFAEFLGKDIQSKFIRFEKWNDQFLNKDGLVVKDAEYTPEPLASCRCDLYPNDLTKLEWREKKMDYVLLFISRNTIIINKTKIGMYKTVNDLAGKTAAVMKGTSYHTWLEEQNETLFKANPIKLKFMPQEDAIKAVSAGKIDFAITGADGALWAVNNFAPNAHVAFPVGKITEYGWCFRKQDKDLQKAVRHFFDIQRSSKDSEINKNWREEIGLSLAEFILFVTSTPESKYK